MADRVTEMLKRFPLPLTALVVGGLLALIAGIAGIITLIDALGGGDDPTPVSIALINQVDERTYVELSGGAWNCQTLAQEQVDGDWRTEAVLSNTTPSTVVVFVTFDGRVACDRLPSQGVTGELYLMTDSVKSANQQQLATYPASANYWELCEYCAPESTSPVGGIILLVVAIGGAGLAAYAFNKGAFAGDKGGSGLIESGS